MVTERKADKPEFQPLGSREIEARFNGGEITSDAGAMLLREIEQRRGIVERFARCCEDHRDPDCVEHEVEQMLRQRIFGLLLGYEDLNDHDELRRDPLFAAACGATDPEGQNRRRRGDEGAALAGKSTLNRVELSAERGDADHRYCKLKWDFEKADRLLTELLLDRLADDPSHIVIDVDPTDFAVHGEQEGHAFHGYYDKHCYLPLYMFAEMVPIAAVIRSGNVDAPEGALERLSRIVDQIRQHFPNVQIVIRGDSAFSRDWLMTWCERRDSIDYVFGFAQNSRVRDELEPSMSEAETQWNNSDSSEPVRVFDEFEYKTLESWSRKRRIVAKAEYGEQGRNPRFVVTSLTDEDGTPQQLYEDVYCQRGLLAEQAIARQLELFANRVSTHWKSSNQLRMYLSAIASVFYLYLLDALEGTSLDAAWVETIRNKLFKIGALIEVTVRRFWIRMSSSYPHQPLFRHVLQQIRGP